MGAVARRVGKEINGRWEYEFHACHFNEAQPDGLLLLRLPKLGDMMSTGEIVWICVQPGQRVALHDSLIEIGCIKLCVELPSPCDAIVEQILVSPGQIIPIGEPLLVLRPFGPEPEAKKIAQKNPTGL